MPRAVVDPNVLVSALISPEGASAQMLGELRDGGYELITSPLLLQELRGVLGREKFRGYLTVAEADTYVELLRSESLVFDDPHLPDEPIGEDPGDEYLIALARATRVDALVSGDPHLIKLRRTLPVFTPAEFLRRLRRA